jgi:hypothetical protein
MTPVRGIRALPFPGLEGGAERRMERGPPPRRGPDCTTVAREPSRRQFLLSASYPAFGRLSRCGEKGKPQLSPPRVGRGGLLLMRLDRLRLDQREVDVVEAFDQALLAEGVELERDHAAVGTADFLRR